MKKLFILIGLAISLVCANASTYVTNNLAATNHTVLTSPAVITSITLWSTNVNPTVVYLMDGYLTSTNTAWTNYVVAKSTEVVSYVTTLGTTNSYTNNVLKATATAHAAAVVTTPAAATIIVPPSGDLITFDSPVIIANRLTVSNDAAGLSFSLKYRTP